jgi:hypothetical protein
MKKLTLLIAFSVIISVSTFSQSCLQNGITFTTQAQIDNFQTNYPGCTEIEGYIKIGSFSGTTNIVNLNGLIDINRIEGELNIRQNIITDLSGLDNLEYVGGDFSISDNILLKNVNNLNKLSGIAYDADDIRAVRLFVLGTTDYSDKDFSNTNSYAVGRHVITPNDNVRRRLLTVNIFCRNMGL